MIFLVSTTHCEWYYSYIRLLLTIFISVWATILNLNVNGHTGEILSGVMNIPSVWIRCEIGCYLYCIWSYVDFVSKATSLTNDVITNIAWTKTRLNSSTVVDPAVGFPPQLVGYYLGNVFWKYPIPREAPWICDSLLHCGSAVDVGKFLGYDIVTYYGSPRGVVSVRKNDTAFELTNANLYMDNHVCIKWISWSG